MCAGSFGKITVDAYLTGVLTSENVLIERMFRKEDN
jgi:hypothetical protein